MFPVNHPLWESYVAWCVKKQMILGANGYWEAWVAGAKAGALINYEHPKIPKGPEQARRLEEMIDPH